MRERKDRKPVKKSVKPEKRNQTIREVRLTDEQRALVDYYRFHPLVKRGG